MKNYLKIVCPFFIILCAASLFVFRSLPASKLWNEYAVVYVPSDSPDSYVQDSLAECDVHGAVSLSGQFLPINVTQDSIEYSLYRINSDSTDFAYTSERNAYFFDRTKNFRLYYIPVSEKPKINSLISSLSARGIKAGAAKKL